MGCMSSKDNIGIPSFHYLFKVVIVGDKVGKSVLLQRYVDNIYVKLPPSCGFDFNVSKVQVAEHIVKTYFWDCSHNNKFKVIVESYYTGAHGIILMYDITNRESFENIRKIWIPSVTGPKRDQSLSLMLVATKSDLEEQRQVSMEEGQALATELGIPFYETSAKDNVNVQEAFMALAVLLKQKAGPPVPQNWNRGIKEL